MKEAFSRVPNYEVVLKTAYQYGIFNLWNIVLLPQGYR